MPAQSDKMQRNEIVVLVHGLIRSKKSMYRLGHDLRKEGYNVYFYDYPSIKYLIREHSVQFKHFIEKLVSENPDKKMHIVTHSLGGIIAREALVKMPEHQLNNFNSLIMLAPPNKGSVLAKISIKFFPCLSKLIKPLSELSSSQDAYVHQVGIPKKIKIGVIAGRFDVKTPPAVTHIDGEIDFVTINSTHTFIMNHTKTRKYISNFLEKSSFDLSSS